MLLSKIKSGWGQNVSGGAGCDVNFPLGPVCNTVGLQPGVETVTQNPMVKYNLKEVNSAQNEFYKEITCSDMLEKPAV